MAAKRVTSSDVAKKAGVSRTTVSLVLNRVNGVNISEETRKRVIRTAAEMQYVPDAAAQSLASGRSKTIGLILSRTTNHISSDLFLIQILNVLTEEASQQGMRLLLEIVDDLHEKDNTLQLIKSKRIDGIIYSGPRYDDAGLTSLHEEGFPIVLMGEIPDSSFYHVDVDNLQGAKKAVSHLLNLGHKKVACITNAPPVYTAGAKRLAGYKQALAEGGVQVDDRLIRFGSFDPQSGYAQTKDLLSHGEKPTALFAASDVIAIGAMSAIHEMNLKIPADIAVVGFDNVPLAQFTNPSLTTVEIPAARLAKKANEMIINLIKGKTPTHNRVWLNTKLIVRKSCGSL